MVGENDSQSLQAQAFSFKSLNEIAQRQFQYAKFKILLPVFWLYITLRYVIRLITGKREQIDVSVFVDTVDKRKSVYHKLNLDNE